MLRTGTLLLSLILLISVVMILRACHRRSRHARGPNRASNDWRSPESAPSRPTPIPGRCGEGTRCGKNVRPELGTGHLRAGSPLLPGHHSFLGYLPFEHDGTRGGRTRWLRTCAGLRQEEPAAAAGCGKCTIWRWETTNHLTRRAGVTESRR